MIQKLFPNFFIYFFCIFLDFQNEVTEIRGEKDGVGGFWSLPRASVPQHEHTSCAHVRLGTYLCLLTRLREGKVLLRLVVATD